MGWQLEVAKMCLYMAFPVGLFHVFNQPEFFEKQVVRTKEEWYPPNLNANSIYLRQEIDKIVKEREVEKLKKLKEEESRLKED